MEKYEITYLVADESVVVGKPVEHTVEKTGGKILSNKVWGQKELAYPVGKVKSAYYATVVAELEGAAIADLNRALKMNPLIIRALIVKGVYEPRVETDAENRKEYRKPVYDRPVMMKEIGKKTSPTPEKVTAQTGASGGETKVSGVGKVSAAKPVKPAKKPASAVTDEQRLAQLEGKLKELLKE